MSFGGFILGTGQIKACLYIFGNLHVVILQHIMSWMTGASSSLKRLSNHAGILSIPVAFLGLRCLSETLICPIDGVEGT